MCQARQSRARTSESLTSMTPNVPSRRPPCSRSEPSPSRYAAEASRRTSDADANRSRGAALAKPERCPNHQRRSSHFSFSGTSRNHRHRTNAAEWDRATMSTFGLHQAPVALSMITSRTTPGQQRAHSALVLLSSDASSGGEDRGARAGWCASAGALPPSAGPTFARFRARFRALGSRRALGSGRDRGGG
jgi:hypothetical protein